MIVRTLVPITDKNGTNLCELIWLQRDFADQSVQSPIYCCNLFLRERTIKVQLRLIKHTFLIDVIAKLTLYRRKDIRRGISHMICLARWLKLTAGAQSGFKAVKHNDQHRGTASLLNAGQLSKKNFAPRILLDSKCRANLFHKFVVNILKMCNCCRFAKLMIFQLVRGSKVLVLAFNFLWRTTLKDHGWR